MGGHYRNYKNGPKSIVNVTEGDGTRKNRVKARLLDIQRCLATTRTRERFAPANTLKLKNNRNTKLHEITVCVVLNLDEIRGSHNKNFHSV